MSVKKSIWFGAALLCLTTAVWSRACEGIIININHPQCAYADSRVSDKLAYFMSNINRTPITYLGDATISQSDFASLVMKGCDLGGRFLVDVSFQKMDIVKRKVTVIPQVVFRYRVFGILTGTIRIIDVAYKRLVMMDRLNFELKASDQWQFADDDTNDPALLIPSDEKLTLFDKLDETAASKIAEDILNLIKDYDLGK